MNKQETLMFNSGWRPAVCWVFVVACAWNWVLAPVTNVVLMVLGIKIDMPLASMSEILPLIMGLVSLGGLRTYEKIKNVASK